MENFSQTSNNRNNIIKEICDKIGIKNDENFRRLTSKENLNILEKLKTLEKSKVKSFQFDKKDINEISSGNLKFTNNLLKNNDNKLDTVQFLTVVENVLKPLKDDILPKSEKEVKELNESLVDLKTILSKNDKRFGVSYHVRDVYSNILQFIDKKLYDLQYENSINSVDVSYHTIILNEYISGGTINPIYKDFSSVKPLITNIQGLIFDFMVIINLFMKQNQKELDFLSRDKVNIYKTTSNLLLQNILSSAYNSILFNKSKEVQDFLNGESSDDLYMNYENLLDFLSMQICSDSIKYNLSNIPIRSISAMIQFVASSSFAFNMKIRNIIKNYCNVSMDCLQKIDKIKSNPDIYRINY
jgi:hypothetical protein